MLLPHFVMTNLRMKNNRAVSSPDNSKIIFCLGFCDNNQFSPSTISLNLDAFNSTKEIAW